MCVSVHNTESELARLHHLWARQWPGVRHSSPHHSSSVSTTRLRPRTTSSPTMATLARSWRAGMGVSLLTGRSRAVAALPTRPTRCTSRSPPSTRSRGPSRRIIRTATSSPPPLSRSRSVTSLTTSLRLTVFSLDPVSPWPCLALLQACEPSLPFSLCARSYLSSVYRLRRHASPSKFVFCFRYFVRLC